MVTVTTRQPGAAGTTAAGRVALRQLWQVPTFIAGLLTVLAICAALPLVQGPPLSPWDRDVAAIRQALDSPTGRVDHVLALTQTLLARTDADPEHAGEAHFLLGSVYLRLADQGPGARAQATRREALAHLEQAERLGVLGEDDARLNYRLGRALFQIGLEPDQVVRYLADSVAQGADNPAEGYRMLAQAYLRLREPRLQAAYKAYLKLFDLPIDDEEVLGPARLACGEILIQQKKYTEALRMLRNLGTGAGKPLLARAHYLQGQCCMELRLWDQAIPHWQAVLRHPEEAPGGRGQVLYYLGLCCHNLEQPQEAEAARYWARAQAEGAENGQAASLRLAELYLSTLGTGGLLNPTGGLEAFRRALAKVARPDAYHNRLVPLSKARDVMEEGCQAYVRTRDFGRALQLAELYGKLARPARAKELEGEIAEAWAGDLASQPRPADPAQAAERDRLLRAQLLRAGSAWQAMAAARPKDRRAKPLWRGAQCLLRGGHTLQAETVFDQFVHLPAPDSLRGEGWYRLAETRLALVKLDPARATAWERSAWQAYYKAIEYPGPFAFRARYRIACAALARRPSSPREAEANAQHAEELFRQILSSQGGMSAPADIREKALFQLGDLLFRRGNYEAARITLQEAVDQYPGNATIVSARDLLGECCRHLAREAIESMYTPRGSGDREIYFRRKKSQYLDKAVEIYQKLADDLDGRKHLSPAEKEVLTKAYFVVVDCRYEQGDYEDALIRAEKLARLYAGRVESLVAYHYVFRTTCGRSPHDQAAIAKAGQALWDAWEALYTKLKGVPDEAFLKTPVVTMTRKEWEGWIKSCAQLVPAPPGKTIKK
jgi:tetratricopeptide (TPR) repeat protein